MARCVGIGVQAGLWIRRYGFDSQRTLTVCGHYNSKEVTGNLLMKSADVRARVGGGLAR